MQTHASDEKLLEAQPSGPEIRYITALCCNLIGTVELAVGPDPEGLGRVITSFQNAGTSAITRMGGAIAYATPDQILGIFGFPAAHEDDPERAVIAGLDAVEAIGQILSPRGQPLHLRVGIATGFALTNQHQTLGEPATLATALSSLTPMDSVTVTAKTRQLLGTDFQCDGLERYVLVGLA
jgi:class 3 adenylate cyclase